MTSNKQTNWLPPLGALLILALMITTSSFASDTAGSKSEPTKKDNGGIISSIVQSTGLYGFFNGKKVTESKEKARDEDAAKRLQKLQKSMKIDFTKYPDFEVSNKDKATLGKKELLAAEQAARDSLNKLSQQELSAAAHAVEELDGSHHSGGKDGLLPVGLGQFVMILIGLLLIYLAISKGFEPLLLLPIGFGGILANIPMAGIAEAGAGSMGDGFLHIMYNFGVANGFFPLLIFMGVGAMTDFGPLIANPRTALLGAAAQFGIFTTLIGALAFSFTMKEAASIGIIGGADGPTSIFIASQLAPHLLGAIAVAAYSYMALVPIIQPPIMNALVPVSERKIEMKQLRHVSKVEKIVFPLIVLGLCALLLPDACPLIGALMFGNLAKESGVVDRLSNCMQNELINIVTIMLGLSVGSKLQADKFLNQDTLFILILGLIAFSFGTAAGLILARIMSKISKNPINPLIGAAGVSAVPMAARVVNGVGLKNNPHNFLLMHAMGPNVAGVIGSAVAAGILLSQLR